MEMLSTLKDIAYTRTTTKMGEDFMTDVVELCTMLMANERSDNQTTQDNTTTYSMEGDNHLDRRQQQQLHHLRHLDDQRGAQPGQQHQPEEEAGYEKKDRAPEDKPGDKVDTGEGQQPLHHHDVQRETPQGQHHHPEERVVEGVADDGQEELLEEGDHQHHQNTREK